MYITCEQCSTIFRLDEKLLKPNGSKVRCSQCLNVFVAMPPETSGALMDDNGTYQDNLQQPTDQYQDTFDQELEGIDLAELDSIMEEGRADTTDLDTDHADQVERDEVDVLADFDEADLDMDFETALDHQESAPSAKQSASEQAGGVSTDPLDDIAEDIDLNMNFELDDWEDDLVEQPEPSDADDLDIAMDMDFELDAGAEDTGAVETPKEESFLDEGLPDDTEPGEEVMLGEDVELALDDFEDVLGGAGGEGGDDLPSVDISDEELELDLGPDEPDTMDKFDIGSEETPEESGDTDLDLSGLDSFLDEDDAGAPDSDAVAEELELSLDDDLDLAPEDAAGPSGLTPAFDSGSDDLDLADLDALLDGDDDSAETPGAEGKGKQPQGDEPELSLDGEPTGAAASAEPDDLLSAGGETDDLDLTGIDDLLDEADEEQPDAQASGDEELSLDDDFELSLDEDDALEATVVEPSADGADDLDLADLDDLLDSDDGDQAETAVSDGDSELSLDDELEFSLDDDLGAEAGAGEPETVASTDEASDDFDLGVIDDLLDTDDDSTQAELVVSDGSSEASSDDELELSLDDEATIAVEETNAAAKVTADSAAEDIDLDDFDDLLGGDDNQADEALSLDDEPELNFEEEPVLNLDDEEKTVIEPAGADRDEFDLSDLEGLLDDKAAPSTPVQGVVDAAPKAGGEEDLEFSLDEDLEFSLDDEDEAPVEAEDSTQLVSSEEGEEDFDLSDLEETMLDDSPVEAAEGAGEDLELSLDDELDQLDLSLDDEIDDEVPAGDGEDLELSLDDEMEFSLDDDEKDAAGEVEDDLGNLEDLEFELDADFEDKPIAQDADDSQDATIMDDDQQDEALDLTDIEKMLEDDTIVPDKADAAQAGASDLGGAETWANDTDDGFGMEDDEIDLTEIEEAIDSVNEEDDLFVDSEQEPELDLDLKPEKPESLDEPEALELELEMEEDSLAELGGNDDDLELTELDLSEEEPQTLIETETIDAGDIQLEFQIEESQGAATMEAAASKVATTSSFMQEEEDFSGEETIAAEAIPEQPEIGRAPEPKSSGGKKGLLFGIPILMLLVVAAYFGYNYTVKNEIRIPFVSDYLNPKPDDPSGILQLATMEINSKFIENQSAGRLFVITGKVRNGYPLAHKLIRLKGKLYTKGKVLVKTEQTFAGLVMADQELTSSSIADIKKRLNTTADQDMAITIEAGKSAPFMVVFSELPADLDEFVIELVSSIKAQ